MPHPLGVILDPPPHGVYTCEDVVSGKVIVERSYSDTPRFVCICFFGVVYTEARQINRTNMPSGQNTESIYADKEVLFQSTRIFHQSPKREEFRKGKVTYEWSFNFRFLEGEQGFGLPSSGKYHDSKVAYKIMAASGKEGEDEEKVREKINPEKKPWGLAENDFGTWARKQIGDVVERKIDFVQIRSLAPQGDHYTPPPFSFALEISPYHLPSSILEDKYTSQHKGMFHSTQQKNHEKVFFDVHCQFDRTVIQGQPFHLVLSLSSTHPAWTRSPPMVTLTKVKINLRVLTIERAHVSTESISDVPIFHHKALHLPLGPQPLDIGEMFSFTLTGEGITPSFDTRLLRRVYHLPIDVTIEVGGKSFEAAFAYTTPVTLLSSLGATSRLTLLPHPHPEFPPTETKIKEIHLQNAHLGRISQIGSELLRPASILEAALILSRLLTQRGIKHSFPGGTLIKLHAYKPPDGKINDTDFDPVSDVDKITSVFHDVVNCPFRYVSWHSYEQKDLTFRYEEKEESHTNCDIKLVFAPHKAKSNAFQQKMDDHKWIKKTADEREEVKLDPVALFNHRLESGVTKDTLSEEQIGDLESLERAFSADLRDGVKKGKININMARLAVGKYRGFGRELTSLGVFTGEEWRQVEEEARKHGNWGSEKEDLPSYRSNFGGEDVKRREFEEKSEVWVDEKKATDDKRSFEKDYVERREVEPQIEERQDIGVQERERRRWDDAEAQGDRNWNYKQSEKERIERLKKAFLERRRAMQQDEADQERWEDKGTKDWDKDEEDMVGRFEKNLWVAEKEKQ